MEAVAEAACSRGVRGSGRGGRGVGVEMLVKVGGRRQGVRRHRGSGQGMRRRLRPAGQGVRRRLRPAGRRGSGQGVQRWLRPVGHGRADGQGVRRRRLLEWTWACGGVGAWSGRGVRRGSGLQFLFLFF